MRINHQIDEYKRVEKNLKGLVVTEMTDSSLEFVWPFYFSTKKG